MNKKRLSVVMAGAMLASAVAPVLAETAETTHGKMGLLIDKLETLMNSKKYHATDVEAGKSVYRFSILDEGGKDVSIPDVSATEYTLSDNKKIKVYSDANVLKKLDAARIYTVKVYELGSIEKNGEFFSKDVVNGENIKYEAKDFADLVADVKAFNNATEDKKADAITKYPGLSKAVTKGWVTNLELKENDSKVVVTLGSKNSNGEFNKIECAVGTDKLTFGKPVDAKGNVLAEVKGDSVSYNGVDNAYVQGNIAGFEAAKKEGEKDPVSIAGKNAKLVHEVKILNGDMNYTVKVDDLYDGFMLTEKGHELMNAVKLLENDGNTATTQSVDIVKEGKGTERYFVVTLVDANGARHIVKVLGDSLHINKISTLRKWLYNRKANVELLAGENRYATAVEIAKTYIAGDSQYHNRNGVYADNTNLVLVNGNALVDGLAAAPYAKKMNAPILLTAENTLPKETKAFMKELIGNTTVGNLKNVTVTIIGGEAVVSNSVVNELREIGVKVKRISGDNREETSLAVADKMNATEAFLVGANGEADAMSIAATAAKKRRPIIVSKSDKGLSTVGVNEVSEYNKVEIVGGEGVVPKSTEDALKELVDNGSVSRLNGKNRFETNALVIKKYHKGFEDALIAKDGQRNKSELVDALPAAIFASSNAATNPAAPIVLATDKISDEQLNQLVLNSNKSVDGTVYQIGNGVARTVMEKVVTKLGLNN